MLDTAAQKSFQQRFSSIRTLEKKDLLSPADALALTLKDAGKNAFFDLDGTTYLINDMNRYEEASDDFKTTKGYFIYELTCLNLQSGKTVFFEWEYDDELEIAMTLDRFSFKDLRDDEGQQIDEDDLDQIADDRDVIVIGNETFKYEDDWAAVFQKGNSTENVYMYEFENKDGTKFLTIEEWQGSGRDEYRIYTSVPIHPDNISLISKGES